MTVCDTAQVRKENVIELMPQVRLEDAIGQYLGLPTQVLEVQRLTNMEHRIAMVVPFSGDRVDDIGTVVEIGKNQYVFQAGKNYDLVRYD